VSTIATNPETEQMTLPIQIDHYRVSGQFFWRCIQVECDGEHHFWCNCRRVA
jgi:hypothetical protein